MSRYAGWRRRLPPNSRRVCDVALVEVAHDVAGASSGAVRADGEREAEPARVGVRRRLGQQVDLRQVREALVQPGEVRAARGDEAVELVELRDADGGLHVGELEVVADVRVDVLVVVAVRQVAELLVEALAAGVLLARLAPAVAAPVAEGLGEHLEPALVRDDAAALAHRDVVGGIEARRREVARGADVAAVVRGADGVAAVLDEQQVVLLAERRDRVEVERVAQRVGDHHRPRPGRQRVLEMRDVDVVGRYVDVEEDRHERRSARSG